MRRLIGFHRLNFLQQIGPTPHVHCNFKKVPRGPQPRLLAAPPGEIREKCHIVQSTRGFPGKQLRLECRSPSA